jgi:hypothetical protein
MYYKHIPAEGRIQSKADEDKVDRQKLKMFMQGKKVYGK